MTESAATRHQQDVGNIISLEHVNVTIDRQDWAILFYVVGLGMTRDPYLMVGLENMWINVGRQQFHLPTRGAQVLRGRIGLVVPSLEQLEARLAGVVEPLAGSRFAYRREGDRVVATCPWGNTIECFAPSEATGDLRLGIIYVEFDVPEGTARGIARFYQEIMGAPSRVLEDPGPVAVVNAGDGQCMRFRETREPVADYDGHHVAIYITDFGGPYEKLSKRGLVSRENGSYEYRFENIVDLDDGKTLFRIEHEVRSLTHPIYARPLVNRNPTQTQRGYFRGRDAFTP